VGGDLRLDVLHEPVAQAAGGRARRHGGAEPRGCRRTGERERQVLVHGGQPEPSDGRHHREGGARVDAKDAGFRQGITGEGLHDYPGHGEGGAHHDREDGAVDAQPPHHLAGNRVVVRQEPLPDLLRAQGPGTQGQALGDQYEEDQNRQQRGQETQGSAALPGVSGTAGPSGGVGLISGRSHGALVLFGSGFGTSCGIGWPSS